MIKRSNSRIGSAALLGWTQLSKLAIVAALLGSPACSPGNSAPPAGATVPPATALADVADHDPEIAVDGPASVADAPTAPPGPNGETLSWTAAPELSGVLVAPNRDSVVITVPAVAGAADYRVFALEPGVAINAQSGGEAVSGPDIYCAGNRQFNAPAPATPVVMQQVEVYKLQGATRLVVEAIDRSCPFVGLRGTALYSTQVSSSEVPAADRVRFGIYTDDDIRRAYGAVIFNGHGAGALAQPAPNSAPMVLARTTLNVVPRGNTGPELAFFDDFSDASQQPVFVQNLKTFSDRNSNAQLLQNPRWNFYQMNYDHIDQRIDRGQLQITVLDRYQDVFASHFVSPRRAVQLGTDDYLHITFSVAGNATQRRYWWILLCGNDTPGSTIDADGNIMGSIVETPFFYQPDGRNPSVEGWNCLQVFPRDGTPFPLPPDNTRPQSDIRVMVNQAHASSSVVNVSPNQYLTAGQAGVAHSVYAGWYRQQDGKGALTAAILDDQMIIAPRARYDMYISRSRVILLVNGQQRLCNDFPSEALTMAEGALGFGQVLYHTTAERGEFSDSFDNRSGQQYYLTNTPYADVRSWDNLGFQEHTRAPSNFNPSLCYVYKP